MNITLNKIRVRDLFNGYINNGEDGIVGYHGNLNIRPKYQREFIYSDARQELVIDTVLKGYPLNIMYWMKTGVDANGNETYDLLDGQQRTLSICRFLENKFMYNGTYANASETMKSTVLDYELLVYTCEGTDAERIAWFERINTAGEKLTHQEILNSTYAGNWCTDAKKFFSKSDCEAKRMADQYLNGRYDRQEVFETVLGWIADSQGITLEQYMKAHMNDADAKEVRAYFHKVINWVETFFPSSNYRKEMDGLPWGIYYNKYGKNVYTAAELEAEIKKLMDDEEVTNKKAIYEYVLSRHNILCANKLNIRTFPKSIAMKKYREQNGVCPICKGNFSFEAMAADHIVPWSRGGKTTEENCQMLCEHCNSVKNNKNLLV